MENKWNLSDKIEYCEDYNIRGQDDIHPAVLADVILVKDVKEAVKLLKEIELDHNDFEKDVTEYSELELIQATIRATNKKIDEIFGDKLI